MISYHYYFSLQRRSPSGRYNSNVIRLANNNLVDTTGLYRYVYPKVLCMKIGKEQIPFFRSQGVGTLEKILPCSKTFFIHILSM